MMGERTIAFDPQLAFGDFLSTCIDVDSVVCEGYHMTNFELIFVIVEHEVSKAEVSLAICFWWLPYCGVLP